MTEFKNTYTAYVTQDAVYPCYLLSSLRGWLLLLGWLLCQSCLSAQSDTIPPAQLDSVITATATKTKVRKPGQALKWALIPGGGQVYNKAWWKVPLVYGALLGAIGTADFNNNRYNRLVAALEAECFGPDVTDDCVVQDHEFTGIVTSTSALVGLRDNFDRNRQTSYLFIVLTYLLQGIEAYTDAHLKTFDMDEDLSIINIKPSMLPGNAPGVGISIPLGVDRKQLKQEAILKARR